MRLKVIHRTAASYLENGLTSSPKRIQMCVKESKSEDNDPKSIKLPEDSELVFLSYFVSFIVEFFYGKVTNLAIVMIMVLFFCLALSHILLFVTKCYWTIKLLLHIWFFFSFLFQPLYYKTIRASWEQKFNFVFNWLRREIRHLSR